MTGWRELGGTKRRIKGKMRGFFCPFPAAFLQAGFGKNVSEAFQRWRRGGFVVRAYIYPLFSSFYSSFPSYIQNPKLRMCKGVKYYKKLAKLQTMDGRYFREFKNFVLLFSTNIAIVPFCDLPASIRASYSVLSY